MLRMRLELPAPATEARLFAPFAVVVAVLAPEARLFAPFGQLNLFLWVWVDLDKVLFVHSCLWQVRRDPGMSHWLARRHLPYPWTLSVCLFYCSSAAMLKEKKMLNSRSEVMILSRARDSFAGTCGARDFSGRGREGDWTTTHKSHFAFPRLPEVVKIKDLQGTPDRTQRGRRLGTERKKRKVFLPEQAWRPQTIIAELDSFLPQHWTGLERPWTTVGQSKTLRNKHKGSSKGFDGWKREEGAWFEGLRQNSHSVGALALPPPPPPFFFLWLLVQFFFQCPLLESRSVEDNVQAEGPSEQTDSEYIIWHNAYIDEKFACVVKVIVRATSSVLRAMTCSTVLLRNNSKRNIFPLRFLRFGFLFRRNVEIIIEACFLQIRYKILKGPIQITRRSVEQVSHFISFHCIYFTRIAEK